MDKNTITRSIAGVATILLIILTFYSRNKEQQNPESKKQKVEWKAVTCRMIPQKLKDSLEQMHKNT